MNTFHIQWDLGDLHLDATANMDAPMIVISGDNGAGKTSLLRCLAGLQSCHGRIQIGNEVWLDSAAGFTLPTQERNIGFVWAESVLLPWLNAEDNIKLGVRDADAVWLDEVCEAFEVSHLCKRTSTVLSTGEAQRIALARAFYRKPELLLLDEPFSAQDPDIRQRLRLALQRLQQHIHAPLLMVSHDADDAKAIATEHWYMRAGKLFHVPSSRNDSNRQEVTQ